MDESGTRPVAGSGEKLVRHSFKACLLDIAIYGEGGLIGERLITGHGTQKPRLHSGDSATTRKRWKSIYALHRDFLHEYRMKNG